MSHSSISEECGKKYQLTDSLLRRTLSHEEADNVEIIEPAIVTSNFSKQLRNLGYKHTVLSSQNFYIINTPAKQESDVLLSVSLGKVVNVALVYDIPDFLQGELKEQAQHVRITFKQQASSSSLSSSAAEELLLKAESLSLVSLRDENVTLSKSSAETITNPLKDGYLKGTSLKKSSNESSLSVMVLENNHKNRRKFKHSLSLSDSGATLKSQKQRPLPKPVTGTEKLNASYTNALKGSFIKSEGSKSESFETHSSSSQSLNSSLDNLVLKDTDVEKCGHRLHGSFPIHTSMSKSWSEIFKEQHLESQSVASKFSSTSSAKAMFQQQRHNSLNDSHLSSSLSRSLSSKLFRFLKENTNEHVDSDIFHQSGVTSTSMSRSNSMHSVDGGGSPANSFSDDLHNVDIYTLSKNSKLYNALREAWIHSLMKATLSCEKTVSTKKTKTSSRKLASKLELDGMINKYALLKEEILQCEKDDQLFLLTKEINFACQHYVSIKKTVWKSSDLLKFYLRKLKSLHQSPEEHVIERMDELDLLIMIGDFMITMFQGSEMYSNRNTFINENSGTFIKDFIDVVLKPVSLKYDTKLVDESLQCEIDELLATWLNTSVSIIHEFIVSASQLNWCCNIEKKSFDTTILIEILIYNEKYFTGVLDHVMHQITLELSNDFELILASENFVLFYKKLCLVYFVLTDIPSMASYIKTYFKEEIKYYICKADIVERLPQHFPLSCVVKTLVNQVQQVLQQSL